MERLTVFLTWSGDVSRAVAKALHDWLPNVLQFVEPWVSVADIEKGTKWQQALSGQLAQATFGIVCLTSDNLSSPWLLFEAGALSKTTDARVWTYLYDVADTDVKDPLSQFQHTYANKEDTRALLLSINSLSGPAALKESRLITVFEKWWPDLQDRLANIPPPPTKQAKSPEPDRLADMTGEILSRIREMDRHTRKPLPPVSPDRPSTAQQRKQLERLLAAIQSWRAKVRSDGSTAGDKRFAEAEFIAQKALTDFNFGRKASAQAAYWGALEIYKAAKEEARTETEAQDKP